MSDDSRRILHSAFSFVRSVESNRAASSITLDHLIQERILSIKSGETRGLFDGRGEPSKISDGEGKLVDSKRISKLDELAQLERDVLKLTGAIKAAGDDPQKLADIGLADEADE